MRRPKIKTGEIYHLKMFDVWVITPQRHCIQQTHEYIIQAIEIGEPDEQQAYRVRFRILASTQNGDMDELKRINNSDYEWQRSVVFFGSRRIDRLQIRKYDPKMLPLYMTWPWGQQWIQKQLKETSHERTSASEPAPAH